MMLAICMPVFNEQDGIASYIQEISESFSDLKFKLIITEDRSSDKTKDILLGCQKKVDNLIIVNHESNQGHGISLIDSVNVALQSRVQFILTCDGDGQVSGRALRSFFDSFESSSCLYGEGFRSNRKDPWFRRIISFYTRLLIYIASGKRTRDGNTPVRIYRLETAEKLWRPLIKEPTIIPNLYISSFARIMNFSIHIEPIVWRDRLGQSVVGAGWGLARFTALPSKRLVSFCREATVQWCTKAPKKRLRV